MLKALYKESGFWGKLLILLILSLFFAIIGMAAATLLFKNASDILSLKKTQLVLSVFTLFIPPLLAAYLWYEKPLQAFSLTKLPNYKQVILTTLLVVIIAPFINLLAFINEQIVLPDFLSSLEAKWRVSEERIDLLYQQMLVGDSFPQLAFNLLVMALMPALGEELFCRGALMNIFGLKVKNTTAVWLVAIIFSLIHFQMFSFIPRLILGAILGYLLVWSGSLWLPIFFHLLNNAIIVIAYFVTHGNIDTMDNFGKGETFIYGIISGIASLYVMWLIFKNKEKEI